MSEHFAFLLKDKHKAAIAVAMSLGVALLLLSPASLRFGGAITTQEAFGQLELIPPNGEQEAGGGGSEAQSTTLPPSLGTLLLRGIIGSSLPAQGGDITTDNSSSYIVAGRWRLFVDEGLVNRFVAEMNLAAINGAAFHNITIEETAPHRFELTQSTNGTTTTSGNGSIPPVSSDIMTRISVNDNAPIVDNVPLTISIRGQVLAIEGIDIDETTITDAGQRQILSLIDGQSIFGLVPAT
ncbi:MAG TPA: hypothetical protein VE264_05160 [Nitrososphaera sp.]|jgi:hypothetical protein|nr:hypothetical protein [Nitrososphaera sp.]